MSEKTGNNEVPVWVKPCLTLDEAAAYSNIGINRIREMAKNPLCKFVLCVGNKRLIKREPFEEYLKIIKEI